jgi:hypothetical protein
MDFRTHIHVLHIFSLYQYLHFVYMSDTDRVFRSGHVAREEKYEKK